MPRRRPCLQALQRNLWLDYGSERVHVPRLPRVPGGLACRRCLMTSKGVMHASLATVAAAPASAAPPKLASSASPIARFAAKG